MVKDSIIERDRHRQEQRLRRAFEALGYGVSKCPKRSDNCISRGTFRVTLGGQVLHGSRDWWSERGLSLDQLEELLADFQKGNKP